MSECSLCGKEDLLGYETVTLCKKCASKSAELAATVPPVGAANTGSTSCRGCANAIDDCANGDNFVCKECSRFYASKWVA